MAARVALPRRGSGIHDDLGGGTPLFAEDGKRRKLELIESQTFDGSIQELIHRPTLHG